MSRITRRNFLQTTSAVAGTSLILTGTQASGKVVGANDRLRIAIAGLGQASRARQREPPYYFCPRRQFALSFPHVDRTTRPNRVFYGWVIVLSTMFSQMIVGGPRWARLRSLHTAPEEGVWLGKGYDCSGSVSHTD